MGSLPNQVSWRDQAGLPVTHLKIMIVDIKGILSSVLRDETLSHLAAGFFNLTLLDLQIRITGTGRQILILLQELGGFHGLFVFLQLSQLVNLNLAVVIAERQMLILLQELGGVCSLYIFLQLLQMVNLNLAVAMTEMNNRLLSR